MNEKGIDLIRVREISSSSAGKLQGDFHVFRYTNVRTMLFPISRRSTYRELRYAPKSGYESAEEFLVDSIHTEAFPEEASIYISWGCLEAKSCSASELKDLYAELQKKITSLPSIFEVESSTLINAGSDIKWLFIEGSENYYSVFWRDTEKKLLSRCA